MWRGCDGKFPRQCARHVGDRFPPRGGGGRAGGLLTKCDSFRNIFNLRRARARAEAAAIQEALNFAVGSVPFAARLLGISRSGGCIGGSGSTE